MLTKCFCCYKILKPSGQLNAKLKCVANLNFLKRVLSTVSTNLCVNFVGKLCGNI